MIGHIIKCKYPYSFNSIGRQLDEAYKTIQLTESHEAGEILDDYWMICNESTWDKNGNENDTGRFNAKYYIKGIDIRYFDIFATDINYDYREDLRKLGTEIVTSENKYIGIVNLYGYIGTDYPKEF